MFFSKLFNIFLPLTPPHFNVKFCTHATAKHTETKRKNNVFDTCYSIYLHIHYVYSFIKKILWCKGINELEGMNKSAKNFQLLHFVFEKVQHLVNCAYTQLEVLMIYSDWKIITSHAVMSSFWDPSSCFARLCRPGALVLLSCFVSCLADFSHDESHFAVTVD